MGQQTGVQPSLGNIFPQKRLIEMMPEDTQVVFIGEFHDDIFHRLYHYLNLPDFAAAGFDFACEINSDAQKATQTFMDHLGYRPDQMQRYEHVEYSVKNKVLPAIDIFPDNFNIFKRANLSPATTFKTLRAAQDLGMVTHFIDNPAALNHVEKDVHMMSERNVYMADKIAALVKQGKKVLVWCGHDHLFSAPKRGTAQKSLQELVSAKGIKTFSTAFTCQADDLMPGKEDGVVNTADLVTNVSSFCGEILSDFYERHRAWNVKHVFPIDLRNMTKVAGKKLPDQLMVFPNFTFEYVSNHALGSFYYKNPVIEDDLWNDLWGKFGICAHRDYKTARKNAPLPG